MCALALMPIANAQEAQTAQNDFNILVWADEFDYFGPMDDDKWFHQTQLPEGGSWFNDEVQHYTNRVDNSFAEFGNLRMVAKREQFTDQGVTKNFTSARLNSKFAFTYGRVEVRAKLPRGVGTWPAIWLLGKNIIETGAYWETQGYGTTYWPACGEIDIMEHWGDNPNYVSSAMHTPSSHGATVNHGGQFLPDVFDTYHVYEMVWTSESIVFSVDGVEHYTYNPAIKNSNTWPYDDEMYILLNIAIQPTIVSSFQSGEMVIDYVRVYQTEPLTPSSTAERGNNNTLQVLQNPVNDVLTINGDQTNAQPVSIIGMDGKSYAIDASQTQQGSQWSMNVQHLPAGVYVMQWNVEETLEALKFVKQ